VLETRDGGPRGVRRGRRPGLGRAAGTSAGLFRSDDAGRTFTSLVDPLSVTCLHVRGDELWVCADEVRDPFSVAVSVDGGATLSRRA
jgi:hypothetical protein